MWGNGFRDIAAGNQFRSHVCRSGPGPMLAAAAAWDGLAANLYSTATSYHSVVSG
ncbi:PPE family protein [Mycobacterium xenopi 3993]|nr:PPE family protein [Mycobacterium xenopi 3993]